MAPAGLDLSDESGRRVVHLRGDWTLAALPTPIAGLSARLGGLSASGADWDLTGVDRLDSAGATLLWRAWGRRWPDSLRVDPTQRRALERVAALPAAEPNAIHPRRFPQIEMAGGLVLKFAGHITGFFRLVGQLVFDLAYLVRRPADIPWKEFSASLYKAGALALPVTALVGFLTGIVISYLSALQLQNFGADVFIVNILGIAVIRELGPVLVAVLVAGRSGSAMTAQIGVMRVTEELDALAAMGVSRTLRLVLPKVAALAVAMPLLVMWAAGAGLVGGMLAATLQLDLSPSYFVETLPKAVPVANLWIGLGKGITFGIFVALIACHFGLLVRPNTDSLAARTTSSVVTAITVVIFVDGIFAILFRKVGIPLG